MKVLGLIPARGGSKGIPRKNIKLLAGKPLIEYTIQSALKSDLLDKTILSSDDPEIIAVAKETGIEVPFVRPSEFAEDRTPSIGVVKHALEFFKTKNMEFDLVCLLQPTSPFRPERLIDKAIETFIQGDFDSLLSVRKVPADFNPHWIFEENENGILKIATGEKEIISRRQDLPPAYYRDGAIYLTKSSVILEQASLYGDKIGFIDNSASPHVNIDTMEDWKIAEELLKKQG